MAALNFRQQMRAGPKCKACTRGEKSGFTRALCQKCGYPTGYLHRFFYDKSVFGESHSQSFYTRCWQTAKGEFYLVQEMETSHLIAVARFLVARAISIRADYATQLLKASSETNASGQQVEALNQLYVSVLEASWLDFISPAFMAVVAELNLRSVPFSYADAEAIVRANTPNPDPFAVAEKVNFDVD